MKNVRATLTVSMLCCAMSIYAASQSGLKQLAVLEPSNAGPQDLFGYWVSVSGNTIVTNGNSGECVFVKPHNGWKDMTQTATLTASDGTLLQYVSISGRTIVATGENGTAYVFVEPSTGWANMTETAKLTASDGSGLYAIAISGKTIVAGAPGAVVGSNQPGAAYVFVEPSGGWADMTQTAELTASDGVTYDSLGYGVAISGGTIVAGAPDATTNSSGNNFGQGAAYSFVEPTGGWTNATETAKLTASDGSSEASLGYSTAIEGNTIVAGAPSQLDPDESAGGAAYVFVEPAGGWTTTTETAQLSPSNGILDGTMGYSVAISGNLVVAGSPGVLGIVKRQLAYEFLEPTGGWQSMTQTTLEGPNKAPAYAEFGHSVSNNGNTVVVAAPGTVYTNYEGLVYVFGP